MFFSEHDPCGTGNSFDRSHSLIEFKQKIDKLWKTDCSCSCSDQGWVLLAYAVHIPILYLSTSICILSRGK